MRKLIFNTSGYNGLNFSLINAEKVNVNLKELHHLDVVENENGDQLILWRTQIPMFRIVSIIK